MKGADLLSVINQKPWLVLRSGRLTGEIHARINKVQAPASLPNARDVMRDAVTRLARLHPSMPWEWIERILERLPDGEALCHGDFHPGQVTLSEGRAAVLDWNGAKRGDALFDYARTRVLLSFGEPPPGTSPPLRFLGKVAVAFWFLRMRGRTNATR